MEGHLVYLCHSIRGNARACVILLRVLYGVFIWQGMSFLINNERPFLNKQGPVSQKSRKGIYETAIGLPDVPGIKDSN